MARRRGVTLLKRARARLFRKQPTASEARAWELLRGRRLLGLKFRRQHVIGGYVVDFVCVEHRVVLEIDGDIHLDHGQMELDANRTACLQRRRFVVLRIPNNCVTRQFLEQTLNEFLRMGFPSPALRERGQG